MTHPPAGKAVTALLIAAATLVAAVLGTAFYFSSSTIHSLLTENHALNEAISNLTHEEQIGFATVESRSVDSLGQTTLTLRFVQTAPGNPREVVDEQLLTVKGNVVHFDALIVKFTEDYVREGEGRALYLWRRVYGEQTSPEQGTPIESPGSAPERYHAITRTLRVKDRSIFWDSIWELANDPDRLSAYGVEAVFGNAVYTRMEPGKVYRFKINASGQIYPEVLDFGLPPAPMPGP
jgi:hypothetical protein